MTHTTAEQMTHTVTIDTIWSLLCQLLKSVKSLLEHWVDVNGPKKAIIISRTEHFFEKYQMLHLKPLMVTFAKLHIWKKHKYIFTSFEVSLTPISTHSLCFHLQVSLVSLSLLPFIPCPPSHFALLSSVLYSSRKFTRLLQHC